MLHIPGQKVRGRSDSMEAATLQTSAPKQAAQIHMECEGVVQEKETDETRHRTSITQDQHEGIQSDVEDKRSWEESVEAEVWFTVDTPAPIDAEGSTAAQPPRLKHPEKTEDGKDRIVNT